MARTTEAELFRPGYTVNEYPYIYTDMLWRVCDILTEPVPFTFVSENRRNNEARAHVAIYDRYVYNVALQVHASSCTVRRLLLLLD